MSDHIEISEQNVSAALAEALATVQSAASFAELKAVKPAVVGDQSPIAKLNAQLKNLPSEQKASAGALLGKARAEIGAAFAARETELAQAQEEALIAAETVDVSLFGSATQLGARHPLSLLQEKISDVFVGMGWEIADGPEVENEWFNFDALNFDADHPARAMQDTFFVEPADAHLVLRTHTSPVQVRSMLDREVPIYVLCPGRVFRTDELDATHTPVFHQVEGLAVDKGLTMADLRGTLEHFARIMFGKDAQIRLRPSFFPFTEPSAELDVWHPGAKGGARWVEWGGCGMVNPNVLKAAGIDPEVYSGFAFGMGIERTLMFRNDVKDMHDMVEADVRFSKQFGVTL